jgi:hypothetical protein
MNRTLRCALSISVLLLTGTVLAQTGTIGSEPAAEPTASSAELSPAASGTETPTTAPGTQETSGTTSPQQEPMAEPLPKTASPLPLIAAVGLLSLGSAVGLGLLRQRATRSRG